MKTPEQAPAPVQPIDAPASKAPFDPIENAVERNPGLTREAAEEMAAEFGF